MATAIAQPVDPLKIYRSDPLIPLGYGQRELSSFEKYRIQREMVRLNRNAKDELDRGKVDSAVDLLYRQLRLSRAIEPKTEIQALGKVGAIFWDRNLSEDVRNVADRLMAIQDREIVDSQPSLELLSYLATAYEAVRYLDKAIDIYQQSLATNNLQPDRTDRTIDKLGELYLSIFDYENAASIYQQKLDRNVSNEEREAILKTLIDIYDRTGKIDRAIASKQNLIEQYRLQNKTYKIPALQMAIAYDLEASNRTKLALEAYDKAFDLASDTKQLYLASNALIKIGKLHQTKNNLQRAIDTYRRAIAVQQQSNNYYGLLNTYDTLGQIYLDLNQKELAKQSFQQGLVIAQSINYKSDYFRDRLKKIYSRSN